MTLPSPISQLPTELLISFFDTAQLCGPYDSLEFVKDVLSWSQVCRHWRAVCLSMPRLWTTIDLRDTSAEEYARRSHPLPLNVVFSGAHDGWEETEMGTLVMSKLPRLAAQTERLFIVADPLVIAAVSTAYLSGVSMPLLSFIKLESTWDAAIVHFDALTATTAPKLRQIELDSASFELDSYSDLTHLSMDWVRDGFTTSELVGVIHRSPHVQKLWLLSANSWEDEVIRPTDGQGRVQFSSLERLDLWWIELPLLQSILAHIYIPLSAPLFRSSDLVATFRRLPGSEKSYGFEIDSASRSVLSIHMEDWHDFCSLGAISDFLDTSSFHTFVFYGITSEISLEEWGIILRAFPSLRHIRFQGSSWPLAQFISALWQPARTIRDSRYHADDVFLELSSLDGPLETVDFFLQQIVATLERNGKPLAKLVLKCASGIHPATLLRLQNVADTIEVVENMSE